MAVSATLALRNTDESFRGKGKDDKSTTHKGKSKESKSGKSGKSNGGKGKSSGKSSVTGKRDPLKQRLESRTQCRLRGEEGHWEEDCPQADVDNALSQTPCDFFPDLRLVSVYLKPGVSKRGRVLSLQKVLKLDSKCGLLKKFKRARTSWVSP